MNCTYCGFPIMIGGQPCCDMGAAKRAHEKASADATEHRLSEIERRLYKIESAIEEYPDIVERIRLRTNNVVQEIDSQITMANHVVGTTKVIPDALSDKCGATTIWRDDSDGERLPRADVTKLIEHVEKAEQLLRCTANKLGQYDKILEEEVEARRRAERERDAMINELVPCQACGWAKPRAPTTEEELPVVRGALDAQEEAERRLYEANWREGDAGRAFALLGSSVGLELFGPEGRGTSERWSCSHVVGIDGPDDPLVTTTGYGDTAIEAIFAAFVNE